MLSGVLLWFAALYSRLLRLMLCMLRQLPAAPARLCSWGFRVSGRLRARVAREEVSCTRAACRVQGGPRSAQWEMKALVREAHRRGMEVVLDVVFNHTAEGNELGPHISFRGIDNRRYYMLAPEGQYYNYSGCGNTFNCNDPVARHFILDCLRFWVQVRPQAVRPPAVYGSRGLARGCLGRFGSPAHVHASCCNACRI